ncbi:MAG: hypothetical protein JKY27_04430 [Magnetovibrio sp.]|nr:hypothetical protein [Magnetovibrio sp.]
MQTKQNKTLGLFASEDELELLIKHFETISDEVVLVALTQEATFSAYVRGIEHQTVDDFYSQESWHLRGSENIAVVGKICEVIDQFLDEDAESLTPNLSADYYHFYFKQLLDKVTWTVEAIDSIVSKLQPDVVAFVLCNEVAMDRMHIQPNKNFFSNSIKLVCQSLDVSIHALPASNQSNPKPHRVRVFEKIKNVVRATRLKLTQLKNFISPPSITIVATPQWSKQEAQYIRKRGISVLPPPAFISQKKVKDVPKSFGDEVRKELSLFFQIKGKAAYWIVEEEILYFLTTFHQESRDNLRKVKSYLKQVGADAVLSVAIIHPTFVTLAVAAKQMGLPVVVLQHGGANGYCDDPIIWYYDLLFAGAYFSYGPGVNTFFKHQAHRHVNYRYNASPKMYSIGRRDLVQLYHSNGVVRSNENTNDKGRKRRKVLYITAEPYGLYRYYTRLGGSDLWHWNLQQSVAELCLSFEDVDLVIKPPPTETVKKPLGKWLKFNRKIHWRSEQFTPLPRLLEDEQFDLIICEAPATALLQAASTNSPIIAIFDDRYISLQPEAEALLQKRMFVACSDSALLNIIEGFLDNTVRSSDVVGNPSNVEFLNAYGHPDFQEQVSIRMVDSLFDLLNSDK